MVSRIPTTNLSRKLFLNNDRCVAGGHPFLNRLCSTKMVESHTNRGGPQSSVPAAASYNFCITVIPLPPDRNAKKNRPGNLASMESLAAKIKHNPITEIHRKEGRSNLAGMNVLPMPSSNRAVPESVGWFPHSIDSESK